MPTSAEVQSGRDLEGKEAPMQKLSIKGHLLPGADISATHVNKFLVGLGPVCGMNIFNGPHVKTPDSYDSETFKRLGNRPPEDVNGAVMWDDSGAQMYVFPDRNNWFTLDIYTCKKFDPAKALGYVYQELDPKADMDFAEQDHKVNTPWQRFTQPEGRVLDPENKFTPEMDELFDTDLTNVNEVIAAGKRLEGIVGRAVTEGSGKRLAATYTRGQREQLRALHSDFEIAVDDRMMDDVLSGVATSPDDYPFQPTYDRLSLMEGQAVGADNKKPIMHIGTGWPGTAIGLYRQFGTPVKCIEIVPVVAEKSRKALDKLGLLGEDKLQVITADGSMVNPEDHKAVIISAMVPNEYKKQVIYNMRHFAVGNSEDPLLVLRKPQDSARAFFYQDFGDEVIGGDALVDDTGKLLKPEDPLRSLVYKVRGFASVREGHDYKSVSARARLQKV